MPQDQPRRPRVLLGVAVSLLLLLAVVPWMIVVVDDPLVPSDLAATPSAYFSALAARKTATAIAQATNPARFFLLGVSVRNEEIYSCPGEQHKSGRQLGQGAAIQIYGWYEDVNGTVWFLIDDDRTNQQEWIRSDNSLRISPPNYRDFLGRTSCTSP